MIGAYGRGFCRLLVAAALCIAPLVHAAPNGHAIAAKRALTLQHKSIVTGTNGILSVDYDTSDGRFTIRTGASHPHPGQTVFYGIGTSYITLRDATSHEMFVNCSGSGAGLAGYTLVTMCPTPPAITNFGNGFRAVYTLANWTVTQDVVINGTTLADTNVRQSVTVTNTTHQTRHYGVRYLWDWEIAGNDRSFFRARNPDGSFLGAYTDFPNPIFQLFEEVNNLEAPLFSVYGTVGGGTLIPTPTNPDQVRYASWGDAYSNAWDFSEGSSDSATVHFWGYNTPLTLHGGDSATFVEYVTTQITAVTPPSAQVSVSSNALSFGDVPVGTASAAKSVTITSTGEVPYQINSFGATANCQASAFCDSADFICSTNCATAPASYGTNASCTVSASFAPNTTGPQNATIYICDNANGSPRAIALSGNGTPAPALTVTPSTFDFGAVLVGARSPANTFTVTNPGATTVTIGVVSTIGDFPLDFAGCTGPLAPGASCVVRAIFAPTLPGRADGWLVIPDAATSAETRVSLAGSGIQEARLQAPPTVDLGAFTLGGSPLAVLAQLGNIGNAVVTLGAMTVDAPFTLESDCPLNLMPGQGCILRFGFATNTLGTYRGNATIASNATGGTLTIALTARALPQPVAIVTVSPSLIGFGDRLINTASPPQRVTVTNEGSAAAIFTAITISADFIVVSTTCGAALAPTQTCFIDVAMRALAAGPRGGQLLVNSTAVRSPAVVDLAGTGCKPFMNPSRRLGGRSACSP